MSYDSVQLLTALDQAVRNHLLPYFSEYGAVYSSGISGRDNYPGPSTVLPKPFTSVGSHFFWWIHRFKCDSAIFDIGFGDREFIVETALYYPAIKKSFSPWELLLACEVHDSQAMSGNAFVGSTDFMERTIAELAEGTRKYWPTLSHPKPHIIDRAQELRGRRLIFAQEEQRKRDRESASIQASRAFHENRIDEAIKLLTPFKNDQDLSSSSKMLLRVAQKRKR